MTNQGQDSESEVQKLCREIGLKRFHGTVCTTYNEGRGYSWGQYQYEDDSESSREYVVDGEPVEKYQLIHKGSLEFIPSSSRSSDNNKVDSRISQRITLKFLNNLHEISQEYRYEVRVIAETNIEDNEYYHEISCGIRTRRNSELLIERSTNETLECDPLEIPIVRCFHFLVRRFSSKGKNSSDDAPSVGEMLFNDEFYSDASLVVGDRIFSIHKRVLALRSDVFKSMFTHRMTENEDGIVKIDDFDAEVMEELIFYIYTNKTRNLPNISRELFEAAHKYQIHDLEAKCKEHMIFNLNFGNAVDLLNLTSVYDLRDLRDRVSTFLEKYEEEMVQQENFQNFLYRDLNLDNVASTLLLCVKYNLEELKMRVFGFLKDHKKDILEKKDFMDLFDTQTSLMREIFRHLMLH